jgi:hypothetical protein
LWLRHSEEKGIYILCEEEMENLLNVSNSKILIVNTLFQRGCSEAMFITKVYKCSVICPSLLESVGITVAARRN